jgi:hypothetical protein
VQEVALVDIQLSVTALPLETDVGDAVSVTDGDGIVVHGTLTPLQNVPELPWPPVRDAICDWSC